MKKIILFFFVIALAACGKSKYQNDDKNTVGKVNNDIRINLFTHSAADTLGCRCYYSVDTVEFNKKRYLYMNNYADISYMKINDEFVKFVMAENQCKKTPDQKYPIIRFDSDKYTLFLEVYQEQPKNELTIYSNGTLTLIDKAGHKTVTRFYGESSCR